MLRVSTALCSAVLVATVTACSAAQPQAGNLLDEGEPGEVCTPGDASGLNQLNVSIVQNDDPEHPVVIDEARLTDDDGVELEDTYVLSISDWQSLTVGGAFDESDPVWQRAGRVGENATVAPGQELGLVLVVRPEPGGGTSGPVSLRYTKDGKVFESRSSIDLKVMGTNEACV